jgi:hypothetical protein
MPCHPVHRSILEMGRVLANAKISQRVIYASSIHALSGYADVQVKTSDPVIPVISTEDEVFR